MISADEIWEQAAKVCDQWAKISYASSEKQRPGSPDYLAFLCNVKAGEALAKIMRSRIKSGASS